ncbi:MAG: hypothetical protein J0H63_08010 [Rhizobiales bacterium]|nr:hypothetical protein [Hyphomicrobiales bacterium]MBN9010068.1 hypothetical protein [Hyphomicrobiales bacterium]
MNLKLSLAAAATMLIALSSTASADWFSNWQVNLRLHDHWYMKPVERFFAVNGAPQKSWDTVGGIVGLGSQYAWVRGSCKVLIRTGPDGRMASLNSYGACASVVR